MTLFEKLKRLMDSTLDPENQCLHIIAELMFTVAFSEHNFHDLETVIKVLPQKQDVGNPIHLVLTVDGCLSKAWFLD
jgi:hypothetical protein